MFRCLCALSGSLYHMGHWNLDPKLRLSGARWNMYLCGMRHAKQIQFDIILVAPTNPASNASLLGADAGLQHQKKQDATSSWGLGGARCGASRWQSVPSSSSSRRHRSQPPAPRPPSTAATTPSSASATPSPTRGTTPPCSPGTPSSTP